MSLDVIGWVTFEFRIEGIGFNYDLNVGHLLSMLDVFIRYSDTVTLYQWYCLAARI